jgi:hypothetical protein
VELEKVLADSLGKHVLLFTDCVPVEGHTASAIYDLTRGRISTFPSAYFPLIKLFRTHRLGELLDTFCRMIGPIFMISSASCSVTSTWPSSMI